MRGMGDEDRQRLDAIDLLPVSEQLRTMLKSTDEKQRLVAIDQLLANELLSVLPSTETSV